MERVLLLLKVYVRLKFCMNVMLNIGIDIWVFYGDGWWYGRKEVFDVIVVVICCKDVDFVELGVERYCCK